MSGTNEEFEPDEEPIQDVLSGVLGGTPSEVTDYDIPYAVASHLAYHHLNNGGDFDNTQRELERYLPNQGYTIDRDLTTSRGMVIRDSNNNAILAYRGTDPTFRATGSDIYADSQILLGGNRENTSQTLLNPNRFQSAQEQFSRVAERYGRDNIHLTGHSLGGTLADYIGRQNSIDATTFNQGESPTGYVSGLMFPERRTQTTRMYIVPNDLISASARAYDERADVRLISQRVEQGSLLGSHSLGNFLPTIREPIQQTFTAGNSNNRFTRPRDEFGIIGSPIVPKPTELQLDKERDEGRIISLCEEQKYRPDFCKKLPRLKFRDL
jgi:hypothetical protein